MSQNKNQSPLPCISEQVAWLERRGRKQKHRLSLFYLVFDGEKYSDTKSNPRRDRNEAEEQNGGILLVPRGIQRQRGVPLNGYRSLMTRSPCAYKNGVVSNGEEDSNKPMGKTFIYFS